MQLDTISVPPLPFNESERLADLETFKILDTLPEAAYDAITFLAAQICDVPIALISIVDQDRQWFKSRVGLDVAETSRDLAFCAHAILEPEAVMVIPDATADARFVDNPLVTGDPSIRFYAGAPLVTQSGNALGTICVIDRSPRTLTPSQEQALRALSVQVMALLELRWTVDELHRNQDELRQVMRSRETFLASVSHEIRTPLAAVVGYVDLLTDPHAEIPDEDRAEMMATVGRQAGDVSHLLEDLLAIARAEAGNLEVRAVEVNLAAQVAQVLEGLDQERVASVRVDTGSCRATGDPARVRQIVRNLLSNAFRYGGPTVSVTVRPQGDRCRLEVSDDGAGIPVADREQVFQPFGQATGGTKVSESVGLGLPISRLLAERMGGALTYEQRAGKSVFLLDLPGVSAHSVAAASAAG